MISRGTIVRETPTFPSPRKESHCPLLWFDSSEQYWCCHQQPTMSVFCRIPHDCLRLFAHLPGYYMLVTGPTWASTPTSFSLRAILRQEGISRIKQLPMPLRHNFDTAV